MQPQGDGQKHLVDIVYDVNTDLIYSAGMPGLVAIKPQASKGSFLGTYAGKFEHVEVVSSTVVAVTSRGKTGKKNGTVKGQGLYLIDVSNPASMKLLSLTVLDDASGMASFGSYLYVVTHGGDLVTFDVTDPLAPQELDRISGLGNPWEITISGGYGYIADNSLGLVVVDLAEPAKPVLGDVFETVGGAQDIAWTGDHLFLAVGSAGLQIFDIDDPSQPVSLGTTPLGGGVISVSVATGVAWATNQESVLTLDVSDPANPIPTGVEDTPSWAMHVVATPGVAYVADWKTVSAYSVQPDVQAPDLDTSLSGLYFVGDTESVTFTITNRGGAPLDIAGMDIPDDRFAISVDSLSLEPGQHANVRVIFEHDGDPVDTILCVATNDPDEPLIELPVQSTSDGSSVLIGEMAPDFALNDLEGNLKTLAAQKGKPVVLLFFATW